MRDFWKEVIGFFAFFCGTLMCPNAVNRFLTNVIGGFLSGEFWFQVVQGIAVLLILVALFNGHLVVEVAQMVIDFNRDLWSQRVLNKSLSFKLTTTKNLVKNMADHCKEPITLETITDPLILNCGHVLNEASYDRISRGFNPSPTCPICRVPIQRTTKCYVLSCVVSELHKLKAMHGVS